MKPADSDLESEKNELIQDSIITAGDIETHNTPMKEGTIASNITASEDAGKSPPMQAKGKITSKASLNKHAASAEQVANSATNSAGIRKQVLQKLPDGSIMSSSGTDQGSKGQNG